MMVVVVGNRASSSSGPQTLGKYTNAVKHIDAIAHTNTHKIRLIKRTHKNQASPRRLMCNFQAMQFDGNMGGGGWRGVSGKVERGQRNSTVVSCVRVCVSDVIVIWQHRTYGA